MSTTDKPHPRDQSDAQFAETARAHRAAGPPAAAPASAALEGEALVQALALAEAGVPADRRETVDLLAPPASDPGARYRWLVTARELGVLPRPRDMDAPTFARHAEASRERTLAAQPEVPRPQLPPGHASARTLSDADFAVYRAAFENWQRAHGSRRR